MPGDTSGGSVTPKKNPLQSSKGAARLCRTSRWSAFPPKQSPECCATDPLGALFEGHLQEHDRIGQTRVMWIVGLSTIPLHCCVHCCRDSAWPGVASISQHDLVIGLTPIPPNVTPAKACLPAFHLPTGAYCAQVWKERPPLVAWAVLVCSVAGCLRPRWARATAEPGIGGQVGPHPMGCQATPSRTWGGVEEARPWPDPEERGQAFQPFAGRAIGSREADPPVHSKHGGHRPRNSHIPGNQAQVDRGERPPGGGILG